MSELLTWSQAGKDQKPFADFLKAREVLCVGACANFIKRDVQADPVWFLHDRRGKILALIITNGACIFPVFGGCTDIPIPRFMDAFLKQRAVYAIQGLVQDVKFLETVVNRFSGYRPSQSINYDLMMLDRALAVLNAGPSDLILRPPRKADMEELFRLQCAYEQEEVLPRSAVFNTNTCRRYLESIVSDHHILIAELRSRIVGKINTSVESFRRYQIGGVFVHPKYREMGIASCMAAAFVRLLLTEGRGLSLFVKKRNVPARKVYRRIGFTFVADYRISYF
jgi:predicted GNAT family acetyltransferase